MFYPSESQSQVFDLARKMLSLKQKKSSLSAVKKLLKTVKFKYGMENIYIPSQKATDC
jgi:hypothetical protein